MNLLSVPYISTHKIIEIVGALLLLYGCSNKEAVIARIKAEDELVAKTNIGLPPSNIEQLIKKWGDNNLKDPNSAEYSHIGTPNKSVYPISISDDGNQKQRVVYSVYACINAKNSYGGYTGKQRYVFYIEHGYIIDATNIVGSTSCTN